MAYDTGQSPTVTSVAELDIGITGNGVRHLLYLEATNTFLIAFSNGNVYYVNGGFDTGPLLAARFDSDFELTYNLSCGTVVAVNDRLLGYRGYCDDTFCLSTILDEAPSETIRQLRLEIPPTEAVVWMTLRQTLNGDVAPVEPLASLKGHKSFMTLLDAIVDTKTDDRLPIVIHLKVNGDEGVMPTDLTIDGLTADLTTMGKQMRRPDYSNPGYIVPTSLILGLLERITMRRFPAHPFHVESESVERDANDRINHDVNRLLLCSEATRRLTFYRWPHPEYPRAYAAAMAEAGFYHNPLCMGEDRVMCFACGVCLVIWEPGDDPTTEHQRHSPKCTFAGGPTHCNVPRVATMAGVGALRWARDGEGMTGLVVGNASPGCNWMTLATADERQSVDWAPEIRLYNLDGIAEMFHCLTVNIGAPSIANVIGLRSGINGRARPIGGGPIAAMPIRPLEEFFTPPEEVDEVTESAVVVVTALASDKLVDTYDNEAGGAEVVVFAALGVDVVALNSAGASGTDHDAAWWIGDKESATGPSNNTQPARRFRPFIVAYRLEETAYVLNVVSKTQVKSAPLAQPETVAAMDVDNEGGEPDAKMEVVESAIVTPSTTRKEFGGPIALYDRHDLRVCSTRCMRLPTAFDSSDYRIDHLVCSDVDSGYLAVGVNGVSSHADEKVSGLLVYPAVNNEWEETDPIVIQFSNGRIEQILVLPWDYFINRSALNSRNGSQKSLCSILVRFADGSLVLADPGSGRFIRILADRQVALVALSRVGAFSALTAEGMLLAYDIKPPTQLDNVDAEEARAIAIISMLPPDGDDVAADFDDRFRTKLREQSFSPADDILRDSIIYQPLNSTNLSKVWSLTRARHPAVSPKPSTARLSTIQQKFATNSLSDLQIHAPLNWIDGHMMDGDGDEGRWHFSPQNTIQQRPTTSEKFDSCLFQLQILPTRPLSHVNVSLKFHKYARACPDMQMSVLRFRAGRSLQDLLGEEEREASSGAKISVGNELSDYGLRLALATKDIGKFKRYTDVVVGPVPVRDYVIDENTFIIQLNSALLYTGICDETTIDGSQWMGTPQKFYILFEPLTDISPEQLMWEKMKETTLASHQGSSAVKRSKNGEKMDLAKSKKKRSMQKEADGTPRSLFTSISFTVYASDNSVPKDKLQCILLLKERKIHAKLLRVAAGLTSDVDGFDDNLPEHRRLLARSQALDVLLWLVETWRVCSDRQSLLTMERDFRSVLDAIFRTGFVGATTRSIPQKWTMILREFVRLLKGIDTSRFNDFLIHVVNRVTAVVSHLHRFETSSALTWFFSTLTVVLRGSMEPSMNENMTKAVVNLLANLSRHTDEIGREWRVRWEGGLNAELARESGWSGLIFEQALFDHPARVMSIWAPTGDSSPTAVPNSSGLHLPPGMHPPTGMHPPSNKSGPITPSLSKKYGSYMLPVIGGSPSTLVPISITMNALPMEQYSDDGSDGTISTGPSKLGGKKLPSTSVVGPQLPQPPPFGGMMDSMANKYYFYVHSADGPAGGLSPMIGGPPGMPSFVQQPFFSTKFPGFPGEGVPKSNDSYFAKMNSSLMPPGQNVRQGVSRTADSNDSKGKYSGDTSKHATATFLREHAIDEITWLQMSETKGTSGGVPTWPAGSNEEKLARRGFNIKPAKLFWPTEQASQSMYWFTGGSGEPARTKATTSKGATRQGDTIKRKVICGSEHMPGLLEVEPLAFSLANASEPMSCIGAEFGEAYTVPCMVTTSASSKHSNDKSGVKSSPSNDTCMSTAYQTWPSFQLGRPADVFIMPQPEHFTSPDILSLSIERMTAAVVKNVILDFGDIVLLTDLMMPACEYVGEVTISVSCTGDDSDHIRLLTSTELCKKCLTLSDIQLPVFARYAMITFASRRLYDFPCLVPLPMFFGTRFYSTWQAYSAVNFSSGPDDIQHIITQRMGVESYQWEKLRRLNELADETGQRYRKAIKELRRSMFEHLAKDIAGAYANAVQYRLEWNRLMFLIRRVERDLRPDADEAADGQQRSLHACGSDQLRFSALSALSFVSRAIALMNMGSTEESAPIATILADVITIDLAVHYFESFCCETVPQLQLQCCTWLFHAGNASQWWSDFFPTILRKFFGAESRQMDNIFYLLSYLCCESVVFQHLQKPIMEKLLEFVVEELNINKEANEPNIPRLSWALLLISSAFDVITPLRKKRDRWAFLTGDFSTEDSPRRLDDALSSLDYTAGLPGSKYNKKSANSILNTLMSAKKKYNKLSTQVKQMQPSDLPAAEILKVQEHFKSTEAAYGMLKNEVESILTTIANDLTSADAKSMLALAKKGAKFSTIFGNGAGTSAEDIGEFGATDEELLDMPSALGMTFPHLPMEQSGPVASHISMTNYGWILENPPVMPPPGFPQMMWPSVPPPTLSKSTRAPSASTSAGVRSKSGASSGRHYSVHMKLAPQLCIRVLRSIVNLCSRGGKSTGQLPLLTQLVANKIIAKIVIHGSHKLLPFLVIFEEDLREMIVKTLSNDCNQWVRYALLQMFLDVTEAEIYAYQKQVFSEFAAQARPASDDRPDESTPSTSAKWSGPKRRKETEEDTEDEVSNQAPPANQIMNCLNDVVFSTESAKIGNDSSPSSLTTISDQVADTVVSDMSVDDAARTAAESLSTADSGPDVSSPAPAAVVMDNDQPMASQTTPKNVESSVLRFDINCQMDAMSVFLQPSDIFAISASGAAHCGSLTNSARTRRVALLLCDSLDRSLASRQSLAYNHMPPAKQNRRCKPTAPSKTEATTEADNSAGAVDSSRTSVTEIVGILHGLIRTLNPTTIGEGVAERLLDLYWLYHTSVSAFLTKASSSLNNFDNLTHLKIPLLLLDTIDRLMRFAVKYAHMDESLWSKILRIIEYSLSKAEDFGALSCAVVKLDVFQPFLECFCVDSLNKFRILSTEGSYGPVLADNFAQLLDRLFKQPSADLLNKVVTTLCNLLAKDQCGRIAMRHFPLDVLMEMASALAANIQKCIKFCDAALMSRLYALLLDFTAQYVTSVLVGDPRSHDCRMTESHSRSTTICFTSLNSSGGAEGKPVNSDIINLSTLFKPSKKTSLAAAPTAKPKLFTAFGTPPLAANASRMNVPKHLRDSREDSHRSRYETVICNLMRVVCAMAFEKRDLCADIVHNNASAIRTSVDILLRCRSDETNLDDISVDYWEPVSVADLVLFSLLTLSRGTDLSDYHSYLQIVLQQLQRRLMSSLGDAERMDVTESESPLDGSPLTLSMPMAVFLASVINGESTRNAFVKLGGHLIVGEQVEICAQKFIDLWPLTDRSSFTATTLQLRTISNQILGKEGASVTPQPPNPVASRRDASEWINFAPHCTASSSTLSASNLQTLLVHSISHRRSRNVWSANYLPDQEWLDITLTLPHPIIMHEVVIKPPAYTAVNSKIPSSVQVEVCTNERWTTLGCPLSIHNLHRISVSAQLYQNVVSAVRIYLRRPTEVSCISLSQIVLFGSSACHLDCAAEGQRQQMNLRHWLPLLNRLSLAAEPLSVWDYAPRLPERLTALFVCRPLFDEGYELLQQLFFNLDYVAQGRSPSIIQLIVDYICRGKPISASAHGHLTTLLHKLCRCSAARKALPTAVSLNTSGGMAIDRQRQLLYGVAGILGSAVNWQDVKESQKTINTAMATWAAACALWENAGRDDIRYETVGLALEVVPKIIGNLTELALITCRSDYKEFGLLQVATGGLLSALVRAVPKCLPEIIAMYRERMPTVVGHRLAAAFGRICQSATAVRQLLDDGVIDNCLERASVICNVFFAERAWRDELYDYLEELVGIVVFLEKLCVVNIAATHLSTAIGRKFFEKLIHFHLNYSGCYSQQFVRSGYAKRIAYQNLTTRLNKAFMRLARRCISWGFGHRDAFAALLSGQLKSRRSADGNNQQSRRDLINILNQLIIEDEKILVHFRDVMSTDAPGVHDNEFDDWIHPLFGCGENDFVVTVSLGTVFGALTPSSALSLSADDYDGEARVHKAINIFDGGVNGDDLEEDFESLPISNGEEMLFGPLGSTVPPAAPRKPSTGAADDDRSALSLYCEPYAEPLDATATVQQLVDNLKRTGTTSASLAQSSDGYFVLNLSLRNTGDNNNEVQSQSYAPLQRGEPSALERFAQIGGLLELSYYLDVRHCYQNMCLLRDKNQKSADELVARVKTNKCEPLDRYLQVTKQLNQTMDLFGDHLATIAIEKNIEMEVNERMDEEDQSAAAAAVQQKSSRSIFGSNSGNRSYEAYAYEDCDDSSDDEKMSSVTEQLSQYVFAALGVFLRLDGYGQLFVTVNRNCAKRILRSALNTNGNEKIIRNLIASLRPATAASKKNLAKMVERNDATSQMLCSKYFIADQPSQAHEFPTPTEEELALYPFTVLTKFLQYFSPANVGPSRASEMRRVATSLGVFDILLHYLSHFTRQPGRFESLRSLQRQGALQNDMAKMADVILASSDHFDNLRQIKMDVDSELMSAMRLGSHQASAPTSSAAFVPLSFSGMPEMQPGIINPSAIPPSVLSMTQPAGGNSNVNVDYWAKGTGFGSGTTQQVWNVNEHMAKQRQSEALITCLLKALSAAFAPDISVSGEASVAFEFDSSLYAVENSENGVVDKEVPVRVIDAELTLITQRSCLYAVLQSYLMNDSVLDMSKHIEIYKAVLTLVLAIASTPDVIVESSAYPEFFDNSAYPITNQVDVFMHVWNSTEERRSLLSQLTNLRQQIDFYLERLSKAVVKSEPNAAPNASTSASASNVEETAAKEDSTLVQPNDEDGLLQMSKLCHLAVAKIEEKKLKFDGHDIIGSSMMPSTSAQCIDSRDGDFERVYCDALKPFQFESIPFFDKDGKLRLNFHYGDSLTGSGGASTMQQSRRLAKEAVTLSSSLPLAFSSTIFVRSCEERLDAMKVLITGPSGTPYSNGCFEFDVFFPSDFPNVPVDIHFETTGNRRVRFNPNLYDDGKVCLSILNTWRGRPEERWNPNASTLLQVLVSIQSLILVKEPYFNEPGFERYRESSSGMLASRDYDANIRVQSVRWAMYEMLKNPSPAFKDVIQRHFWLKRTEICTEIDSWIAEMQADVNRVNGADSRTFAQSLASLKMNYQYLKKELTKLTAPEGLPASVDIPAGPSSSTVDVPAGSSSSTNT